MSLDTRTSAQPRNPEEMVRLLQEELAQTNREVMQLTLELETRVEQLRTAEERFRRLAENAPDMIYRYDLREPRGISFVNTRATAVTGYDPEEYYHDPALLLRAIHPDDRELLEPVLRGEVPGGKAIVVRCLHKNKSTIWIEQHHTLVHDAAGAVIAIECIARDVTERRKLEEQFQQSQKMEAVGRLAGGVAHDFNNLLTVILGYAAQLLSELPGSAAGAEELQEIRQAGERAAALTRQLLAFSRRQVLQPRVLDLNTVVADMERMLVRLLGADIRYVTIPAPQPALIRADCGQMEQVLMNLVVNARDAMPEGGTITVKISTAPGPCVALSVSDTGHGMDETTQQRVFEPFFTTKPVGVGTGLGLSTVYGIATQSEGSVSVQSAPGAGTTFAVSLPAVAQTPETSPQDRPSIRPSTGQETILVVEDEPSVRHLIKTLLSRAGFRVLEAPSGAEALRLCASHAEPIHLLLSDMVMPEMRGDELARQLATTIPNLKVLLMSGYSDIAATRLTEIPAQTPFLQKPFTSATLTRAIRSVLDT